MTAESTFRSGDAAGAPMAGALDAEQRVHLVGAALDKSPDAAYIIGADSRIRYANRAAVEMLGYTREEFLHLSIPDINADPDEMRERWAGLWDRVRSGQQIKLETCHRSRDGRTIRVEVAANFLKFGGQEFSCAFARDMTARLASEEQLRLYSFALDQIQDSAYLVDTDNRIVWVNNAAATLYGATPEALTGRLVTEISNASDEQLDGIWQEVRASGSITLEAVHYTRDGDSYPVEIAANYLAFQGRELLCAITRDLTERRRAEDSIRKRGSRMHLLFEIAAQTAVDIDTQLGDALKRSTELLGLEVGVVSHIVGDRYAVEHCYSLLPGFEVGSTFQLGFTYCSISFLSGEVVAFEEVGKSAARGHPCYQRSGSES